MRFADRSRGVEFMVADNGTVLFRLLYQPNPETFLEVAVNAEIRAYGAQWHPVPPYLMSRVPRSVRIAARKEA